jgi:16S rRNA (guanine966-N2)-methyltransferase
MQKKPSTKPRPQRQRPALQHQVRIIGGQWKRTPLAVLAAEGLRPTPDRVRETVFNWLTHLVDNRWEQLACLDLFAGSGALGFEAASRGAASVVMVEEHSAAVREIEATCGRLQATTVSVMRGDAAGVAQQLIGRGAAASFDLIFLDPPYHQDWLARMLPLCQRLLRPTGLLYVEAERAIVADQSAPDLPAWLAGWQVVRADRAGLVFYHLLQYGNALAVEA